MEGTLGTRERFGARAYRTHGEFGLWYGGDALEIIVTSVTEVSSPETEVHGNRATIATLVLKEIGAVFGAYLHIQRSRRKLEKVIPIHVSNAQNECNENKGLINVIYHNVILLYIHVPTYIHTYIIIHTYTYIIHIDVILTCTCPPVWEQAGQTSSVGSYSSLAASAQCASPP